MTRENERLAINKWVEQKTQNRITGLLPPGALDESTRLVLVNAIYFYGEWLDKFGKQSTVNGPFYTAGQSSIVASFMNQKHEYNYFEDSLLKAIEIPYMDPKASMVIFLPNERDGIENLERSFNYRYYFGILSSLKQEQVSLTLPKFTTTLTTDLTTVLARMGMPAAFSVNDADFSGMTGSRNLYISLVMHKAYIEVKEEGTEAAAATVVGMSRTAAPSKNVRYFKADHPFIFVIRDNETGSILFMGKINNPAMKE